MVIKPSPLKSSWTKVKLSSSSLLTAAEISFLVKTQSPSISIGYIPLARFCQSESVRAEQLGFTPLISTNGSVTKGDESLEDEESEVVSWKIMGRTDIF